MDLPGYLAVLERAKSATANAETREDAVRIAAALPDRLWVTSGGQVVVVDMAWIDQAVAKAEAAQGGWPAVRGRIQQQLTAMVAVASGDADTSGPPHELLQDVLARPEFQQRATSRWLEDARKQIGAWLLQLLDRIFPSGLAGRNMAIVFAWIVSIGALVALALWLVTIVLRRSDSAWLALEGVTPPRAPARNWAHRALAAMRDGNLREAVRCTYRASISRFEEQGVWTVDESRTPREYLSLLPRQDPRYGGLAEVTRRFERVWYGSQPATSEDVERLTAHLEQIGCLHGSERAIGPS